VHINAYHQPGVEAGKKAAGAVIDLQAKVLAALGANPGQSLSAAAIAGRVGAEDFAETVFKICEHLAANSGRGVTRVSGAGPADALYQGAAR